MYAILDMPVLVFVGDQRETSDQYLTIQLPSSSSGRSEVQFLPPTLPLATAIGSAASKDTTTTTTTRPIVVFPCCRHYPHLHCYIVTIDDNIGIACH